MMTEKYFNSERRTKEFLNERIIGIITEYTIFKLNLSKDRVIFQCLQNQYSFDVLFKDMQREVNAKDNDFQEAFLATVITYCSLIEGNKDKRLYPVCEFETMDDLLDWYLDWQQCSHHERLEFLEEL